MLLLIIFASFIFTPSEAFQRLRYIDHQNNLTPIDLPLVINDPNLEIDRRWATEARDIVGKFSSGLHINTNLGNQNKEICDNIFKALELHRHNTTYIEFQRGPVCSYSNEKVVVQNVFPGVPINMALIICNCRSVSSSAENERNFIFRRTYHNLMMHQMIVFDQRRDGDWGPIALFDPYPFPGGLFI